MTAEQMNEDFRPESPSGERDGAGLEATAALTGFDPIRAPWEAVAGKVEGLWHVMPVERTGSTVPTATIDHSRDGHEPTRLGAEKVARLIASAPVTLAELQALYRAYVRLLEAGRDRIIDHGGSCDPVDVMEEGDPALIKARAAIAEALGGAS